MDSPLHERSDRLRQVRSLSATIALIAALTSGCDSSTPAIEYPDVVTVEWSVLGALSNGVTVYNGGYGSAIALHPTRQDHFYLLTDRGPNVDTARSREKRFGFPSFAPHIGLFKRDGNRLVRVAVIELQNAAGRKLTGLPNPPVQDATGESAVDPDGRLLPPDPDGVDPEGLAVLTDGTFWVSDEYGPHLLHVDPSGRTIERISPAAQNDQGHALPRVLATRRPNQGMESLTVTPDGRTLVGIMQSALSNPSGTVRETTRATRLLTYDLVTGATQQFVYLQDRPDLSNSAIAPLSRTEFLVLERDDSFGGTRASDMCCKKIYRVNIARATDLSDPADGRNGRLFDGKTLEQLTDAEFQSAGILPVEKTLLVDLLTLPGGYPHDKPEGLAIVGPQLLAVANDDDFGITGNASGALIQKMLSGEGNIVERNEVYFIKLTTPLR